MFSRRLTILSIPILNRSKPLSSQILLRRMSSTLTAAIKEDHQEMYEYYGKYKDALGKIDNDDAAERWCRQFMWEIARHAVGEEIVVYPLMEKHLGQKGKQLADHDRDEHQEVKKHLTKLDTLIASGKVGTEEFDTLMKICHSDLKHHNENEERDDLPLLEPTLGIEGSKTAASQFARTKKFAPTRGHPWSPSKPPLEFAAFLITPIDILRDMFAKFPTQEMKSE